MPYGPGKFEGEPASTYLVYLALMDGADEDAGNHAMLRGFLLPGNDLITDAMNVGYTAQEIHDSVVELSTMAGAIMFESEQGFVHGTLYDNSSQLEQMWKEIVQSYDAEEME